VTAPNTPSFSFDPELKRKLLFTLLALVIYRIGAHIAAPGVNVQALSDFIRNSAAAGFFGLYDMLGGGLSRATVFALGIMPYISASIIFQLVGGVVPTIAKMQKEEEGRKTITQWTRYATVFISFAQAYTFTLFTESIPGAVANPNFVSRMVMVVTLTTGAIFVMWLGEQITERGIGNGMSLLITFSILERLWPGMLQLVSLIKGSVVSPIGGRRQIKVDVRILAATHQDLEQMVRAGRFREDLYYRLRELEILLPPLRERPEDFAPLAQHFLERTCAELGRDPLRLSQNQAESLKRHR